MVQEKNTNIPCHFVRIYDIAEYRISMVNHKKKNPHFFFLQVFFEVI